MKYILGIGLGYQHYKEPTNIKIFTENRLIDDFYLDEDIEITKQKASQFLKNNLKWSHKTLKGFMEAEYWHIPKKFRLYELEGNIIGKNFTLEISCNSNNYSNGFMTKTSLVCPSFIFLLPKKIFNSKFEWFKKAWTIGQKNLKRSLPYCATCGGRGFISRTGDTTKDTCKDCVGKMWFYKSKVIVDWPQIVRFELCGSDITEARFITKNEWMGGDIVLKTPIKKKHGILMFNNRKETILGTNIWVPDDFLHFLDKINKFNEDTRSN